VEPDAGVRRAQGEKDHQQGGEDRRGDPSPEEEAVPRPGGGRSGYGFRRLGRFQERGLDGRLGVDRRRLGDDPGRRERRGMEDRVGVFERIAEGRDGLRPGEGQPGLILRLRGEVEPAFRQGTRAGGADQGTDEGLPHLGEAGALLGAAV